MYFMGESYLVAHPLLFGQSHKTVEVVLTSRPCHNRDKQTCDSNRTSNQEISNGSTAVPTRNPSSMISLCLMDSMHHSHCDALLAPPGDCWKVLTCHHSSPEQPDLVYSQGDVWNVNHRRQCGVNTLWDCA